MATTSLSPRPGCLSASVQARRELAKQPRPALASSPDGHAGAACFGHEAHRVLDLETSRSQHRQARGLRQLGDAHPIGAARIMLCRRARMQREARDSRVLGDSHGVEESGVAVVDSHADLGSHGHFDVAVRACAPGGLDGGRNDLTEEVKLPRKRRSSAFAGHLRCGAAKIEVDVVGPVLADQHRHGGRGGFRLDAVELDRAYRIPRDRV